MGFWKDFWTRDTRHNHRDEKYAEDYRRTIDPETGEESWRYDGDLYFWPLSAAEHRKRRLRYCALFVPLCILDIVLGTVRTELGLATFVSVCYGFTQAALVFLLVKVVGVLMLERELEAIQMEKTVLRSHTAAIIAAVLASLTLLCAAAELLIAPAYYAAMRNYLYFAGIVLLALGAWLFYFLLRRYAKKITCEDGTNYF